MTDNGGTGGGSFPAANFHGEIEKAYNGEFWVNRYHIEAADLAGALSVLGSIYAVEHVVHDTRIMFTKMTVRTNTEGDYAFITQPLNTMGQGAHVGDLLALHNVVRVDFGTGIGRPSRKYLRGCLSEGEVAAFDITPSIVTFFNDNYATPLAALAGYVDVDGQAITSGTTSPKVGMRQLRRGSKKKSTP